MQIDCNIYCRATGKPIATVSDDEFGIILSAYGHLPAPELAAHLERLTLGSMRPSLAWMSVTPRSLDALREAAPRELLAYLMNRMYAPLDIVAKPGASLYSESYLNSCRLRIQIWQSIESATISDEQIDAILFVLLALDSRFGLGKVQKPTAVTQLWQSWTNVDAFVKTLWDWHHSLIKESDDAARRAKHQAEFWSEGNRLTRNSYVKQFAKVTPPSRVKVERMAKAARLQDDVDFLDQLEKELTTRSTGAPSQGDLQPQVPAAPVRIRRFGVAAVPVKES